MTSGPETKLQQDIQKAIRKRYRGRSFFFKVHGSQFQRPGLPDLVGTVDGVSFWLEVKHPDESHPVSELQEANIMLLNQAGAIAEVVESVDQALEAIQRGLKK